jgi:surface antigen
MRLFSSIAILALTVLAAPAVAADALDPADEAFRASSYRQAWAGPIGVEQHWANLATGHSGTVRATKERLDPASRQPCREIEESLTAGDRPATGYAVGCRAPDGTWRIVQASTAAAAPKRAGDIAPADVTPYVAPADIAADGSGSGTLSGLPAEVRILVPWRGSPGVPPPAPR